MATQQKEQADEFEALAGNGEALEAQTGEEGGDERALTEDDARRMGWKPREEFAGDEADWSDWQEWLDVDSKTAPQLRHRNKVLSRKLDQLDRGYKKIERTLDGVKGFIDRSEQRGYERAMAELKERQREAVADADPDAYDRASEQIDRLEADRKQADDAPKVDVEAQQAFNRWRIEATWYGKDTAMTATADAYANEIGTYRDLGMEPGEYLELLEDRVKKEFPHKFTNGNGAAPRRASAVGGVNETRGARNAETFDNLPAEAKAQFRNFEQMGVPIDKAAFARDAWQVIKQERRQ